jgi:hypothetical protein
MSRRNIDRIANPGQMQDWMTSGQKLNDMEI